MKSLMMIMERVRPGHGVDCFRLWACRGAGRGCKRNLFRRRKVHCEDCVETRDGRDSETLGQLLERMVRGDV